MIYEGSASGGSYICTKVKRAKQSENSIKTVIDIKPGQDIDHGGKPRHKLIAHGYSPQPQCVH